MIHIRLLMYCLQHSSAMILQTHYSIALSLYTSFMPGFFYKHYCTDTKLILAEVMDRVFTLMSYFCHIRCSFFMIGSIYALLPICLLGHTFPINLHFIYVLSTPLSTCIEILTGYLFFFRFSLPLSPLDYSLCIYICIQIFLKLLLYK